VGTGSAVAERLIQLAQHFALDEIVVVTWTHDPDARHRSYELLASAFHLRD
jgi:alkanesulfonate monooxygenase SsuD/methylene tetrahydromethanopterin reductase-like flavin-dependent oxidoreductase (luciferase family)